MRIFLHAHIHTKINLKVRESKFIKHISTKKEGGTRGPSPPPLILFPSEQTHQFVSSKLAPSPSRWGPLLQCWSRRGCPRFQGTAGGHRSHSPLHPPGSPHSGSSRASRSGPGRSKLYLQRRGRYKRGDSKPPTYTYRSKSKILTIIPPVLSRSFQGFHITPSSPPQRTGGHRPRCAKHWYSV